MKVLYLDIDSLRPDHLGSYGYKRPTSPNIDRLAYEGTRYTNCYVSDSPCMASRAATISGRFGVKNGVVTHGERGEKLDLQTPTLPLLLRGAGVKTAAVSTFGRHPSPWFYVGWENFMDPRGWHFQATPAWKVNELAMDWLEENSDENFFLWVQYWDAHAVYDPPESCVSAITTDTYPACPSAAEIEMYQNDTFWHSAPMMGIKCYEDYKEMIDLYDAEIRYVDYHVGLIMEKLETLGILDETLIIVSSDHGEELGEHGVFVEHWSTYDGTSKVPLILRYPKAFSAGRVNDQLVYQMDLSSTILDVFGIDSPSVWDSRSLIEHEQRSYLVCGHGLYTAQRSIVTPDWKLIRVMNSTMWNLPEFQLFNRRKDPHEKKSLHGDRLNTVNTLAKDLATWEAEYCGISDPMADNAELGPPGVKLYGEQAMENFLRHGTAMKIRNDVRKPEINLD